MPANQVFQREEPRQIDRHVSKLSVSCLQHLRVSIRHSCSQAVSQSQVNSIQGWDHIDRIRCKESTIWWLTWTEEASKAYRLQPSIVIMMIIMMIISPMESILALIRSQHCSTPEGRRYTTRQHERGVATTRKSLNLNGRGLVLQHNAFLNHAPELTNGRYRSHKEDSSANHQDYS